MFWPLVAFLLDSLEGKSLFSHFWQSFLSLINTSASEFGWNVLIPPVQSANEEADYPHNHSGLWIDATCTRSNDLTWRQLSTGGRIEVPLSAQSGLLFELIWLVLQELDPVCCGKTKTRVCCWCWSCMHAARPEKRKHSCAQLCTNAWLKPSILLTDGMAVWRWSLLSFFGDGEELHSSTVFSRLESEYPDTFSAVSVSSLLRSPACFSTVDR